MSDEVVRQYLHKNEPGGVWGTLWLCVNPFVRVDGWRALGWGLLIVAASAGVAVRGQINYDSAMGIHMNPGSHEPAWFLAFEGVADWLIVALVFWTAAVIFARPRPRILDFLEMLGIGRLPFLLSGVLFLPGLLGGFMGRLVAVLGPALQHPDQLLPQMMAIPGIGWFMAGMAVMLVFMAWGLFLNFFAVKEASGLEVGPAILVFVVGVVLVEVISQVGIHKVAHLAGL